MGSGLTLERLLAHRAGLWEWWPVYLGARGHEAAVAVDEMFRTVLGAALWTARGELAWT